MSEVDMLTYGTPRGSVLSPLLLLIYRSIYIGSLPISQLQLIY